MQINETFSVKVPIQKLWDSLLDPQIIGPCIPGCEKVEPINDKEYDIRDFNADQLNVLSVLQIADADIAKANARLLIMQSGRNVAFQSLVESLEAPTVEKGEADD